MPKNKILSDSSSELQSEDYLYRRSLVSRRRKLSQLFVFFVVISWLLLVGWFYSFERGSQKGYVSSIKVPGYALLRITPSSASIWIDKKLVASDKQGLSLPEGKHQIRVQAKYYKSTIQKFRIYSADATLVRVKLEPLPIKMIVHSFPSHLNLFLNERPFGKTPFSGSWRPGWLRIRVESPHFITHQRDFRVIPGKLNRFSIKIGGLVRIRKQDQAPMVWIPRRYFLRGSSKEDITYARKICNVWSGQNRCSSLWFTAELPKRLIWLYDFWIDRFEVTVGRYRQCVKATQCSPSRYKRNNPKLPVIGVTYQDAVKYCHWAGGRLPTEAEWESAAKGIQNYRFPWGNTWKEGFSNHGKFEKKRQSAAFDKSDGYAFEAPIGSFPKGISSYGIHDLAGNVSEWVADCYYTSFYRDSGERNPFFRKKNCQSYVIRGGSWMSPLWELRTTHRLALPPMTYSTNVGFRCVRSKWPSKNKINQ